MTLPKPVMLYEDARAPNPRRVRVFLAEKGADVPRRDIPIMHGAHKTPEYLRLTGAPVVPALELDNGVVLTESVAICRYLEAVFPEPNLMGRDPVEVAQIEMWNRRVEFTLSFPIRDLFRHLNPRMVAMEEQCPEWGEANRPRVLKGLKYFDERLGESPFLAGPRLSIADISAFVSLDFLKVTKMPIPPDFSALTAWLDEMRARPSAVG
jgi:glutathione S-transferase